MRSKFKIICGAVRLFGPLIRKGLLLNFGWVELNCCHKVRQCTVLHIDEPIISHHRQSSIIHILHISILGNFGIETGVPIIMYGPCGMYMYVLYRTGQSTPSI